MTETEYEEKTTRWHVQESAMEIEHHTRQIITRTPERPAWTETLEQSLAVRERADRMVREAVAYARAKRATWAEIGKALGTSKQSAQERFGGANALPIGSHLETYPPLRPVPKG